MAVSSFKNGSKRSVFSASTDAPTGGLNTRDAPSRRGPLFADTLTNFIASPNGVAARQGYKKYATGLTGMVDSLMPFNDVLGQSRLFASHGTPGAYAIADVTNPGAAITTGASSQSNLLQSRWSHINFTGAINHYLVICNGADPARHWDGSKWVVWSRVDTNPSIGQIGGIEPSKFQSVISHQKRLWFVEANSTRAWYLDINSLGGQAKAFDFGALFPRGGQLAALTSWTMNGGVGMQNKLVAISTSGDTVIYDGTDVSDSTKWSLSGTWRLGPPVGTNCFLPFGGDTLLLSYDGLVPISKFMQATTTSSALSDTIRQTISDLIGSQGSLPGFQMHDYLEQNLLILNVPQINPERNFQLIYHTLTGGWSVFQGWPAQCFATFGEQVFFGGIGEVYQAFVGFRDNARLDGTGGESYVAYAQQSQNNFEKPGRRKRFVRAKVNLQTAVPNPDIRLDCNVDYDVSPPDDTGAVISSSGSVWDAGRWDNAKWGNSLLTNNNQWVTLGKIGYSGAIVLVVSVQAETLWISTDWEVALGSS